MGQQVLGHLARVAGGHELTDRPPEGRVLVAAQEDAHEGRQHQRNEEEDAHHHRQRLGGEIDAGALQSECSHHHLDLEPDHRDGQEVHACGGDGGLAASGQEQRHDNVATQEAEGDQERDPVGQEMWWRRKPRCRQVLQREREGHDGDRDEDCQHAHREARRAERRREAEQAVRHHQEQGDDGLGHVLVRDETRVDLQGQRQPAENGERQRDPPCAADPVTDPLEGRQRSEEDEFDQRDIGQNVRPVGHRACPSCGAPPLSPSPATVPPPGMPDPELLRKWYSSRVFCANYFRQSFARADLPLGKLRRFSTTRVQLRTRCPEHPSRR